MIKERRDKTEKVSASVSEVVRDQLPDLCGAKLLKAEEYIKKESNAKRNQRTNGKSEFQGSCQGGEKSVNGPIGWKDVDSKIIFGERNLW